MEDDFQSSEPEPEPQASAEPFASEVQFIAPPAEESPAPTPAAAADPALAGDPQRIPATDQEGEYATLQWDLSKRAFWYLNSLRERCYHEPAGERFGADGTMLPEKEEA